MIGVAQRPACQPLAHRLFLHGVHVQRVAHIATHRHTCIGHLPHQSALAVSEPRPRRTIQARQLHVVERQAGVFPRLAPTAHQQFEQPFVGILVMRVRFSLIPDDTFQRITLQGDDARLEQVARLVRMALIGIGRPLDVQRGTLGAPSPE